MTLPKRTLFVRLPALALVSASIVVAAGCVSPPGASQASDLGAEHPYRALCTTAAPNDVRCHSAVLLSEDGTTTVSSANTPLGLKPADLQGAYAIPPSGGGGVTVAIVDAYDDPNAESDLAVYRAQFGLPPCTTANGCFRKVSQTGKSTGLPASSSAWAGEISLDVDMVSAACPACKILLVEANSAALTDVVSALHTAVAMGATVVSNSYGSGEPGFSASVDAQYFGLPGVAITASSGDNGYGVAYPASSPHVIAVGGTSLVPSSNARGWTEAAWSGAGSGCSAYYAKPSYQKDPGCPRRTVVDVSAVADPNTGVAVYDTFGGAAVGATGWLVFGGTSVASPLVAGILAASGHAGQSTASWLYAHAGDLYDATGGTNGTCSNAAAYLCTGEVGYDGPTGLGSPDGVALAGAPGGSSSSSSGSSSSSTSSSSGSTSSSSTSSSSGSASSSSSSSSGGATCGHPICAAGAALDASCDPCAAKICEADTYCCHHEWDRVCVGEVGWICGQTCP